MATPPTPIRPGNPPPSVIQSSPRDVQVTAKQVQPPSPLYLQPEDSLTILLSSPIGQSYGNLALNLRFLRPDGEITLTRKLIPGAGITGSLNFTLGEGFLLSATLVSGAAGPTDPSIIFATLLVQRDLPETAFFPWVLFSDTVTTTHFPSWPYGRNSQSHEVAPRIRSVTGSTPAAGAEISETVPTNVRWKILVFHGRLTTSVAVANRIPTFTIDDGANILFRSPNSSTQAASLAQQYSASPGLNFLNDGNLLTIIPFPNEVFLATGFRIRTQTFSLQAADQWDQVQYLVQEWITA